MPRTTISSMSLREIAFMFLVFIFSTKLTKFPSRYVRFFSTFAKELDLIYKIPHAIPVSGHHGWNFDDLLEMSWDYLGLIRIYTKPRGQLPDYAAPVVLRKKSSTIEDFCDSIHRSIISSFKHALVWGTSVKFNPQKVGKEHQLHDEDVVQIVKKIAAWFSSSSRAVNKTMASHHS